MGHILWQHHPLLGVFDALGDELGGARLAAGGAAVHTWRRILQGPASITDSTSRAKVSDSTSSSSMAASAKVDSGWFNAKFGGRSTVGPDGAVGSSQPLDHARPQQRPVGLDRRADVTSLGKQLDSWLSSSSVRIEAKASPGRATTLSSIE